jgi:hypothetical protein
MTAAALRPSTDTVADLDLELAAHPDFGDGYAIERRSVGRLRAGLLMLARRVPAAATAALEIAHDDHALLAVLGDPVLRNAFERDLTSLTAGRPLGAAALAGFLPTVDLSAHGPCQRLAEPSRSAWPAHGGAWVWTAIEETTGPVAARLWQLLRETFPRVVPVRPLDHDLAALRRGAAMLADLLPGVGGTALRHVRMVGLAREEDPDAPDCRPLRAVSGDDGLPGALFVAPAQLRSQRNTARLLLREGLRLALFEIVRCRPMLVPESPPGAVIPVPWRAEPWPAGQALFALHGYVHLALLRAAAHAGRQDTALARACYLAHQLEREHARLLTPHGLKFVRWLTDAVVRLHSW